MRLATLGALRLPSHSVRLMASMLRELECDVDRAFRWASIPPDLIDNPAATVTGIQELAFQRAFMRLTPESPAIWLELGSRYRLLSHAHNCYGLLMATAPSVQAALEVGLTYGDLYYMLAHAEPIYVEGLFVGFRSLSSELPADLRRFSTFRDIGVNCSVLGDLWGEPFPFARVELPLEPSDQHYVRQYLPDAEIEFGAGFSAWHWTVSVDQRQPPQSDRILHEFYRQECEALISSTHCAGDIVDRLTGLLSATQGQISLDDAARELGLSSRTLQRRLNDRGLSYRDLTTLKRHQSACRLLTETRTPISRIALQVGYDNASSFNFAFRRHAGVSPSRYRQGVL